MHRPCRRRSDRISLPPTRCDFFARPPVRAATFARIVEPRGGGVPSFSMMRIAMRRWRPSRRPWQAAHIEIQHGRKESGRGRSTGIARDDENRIARAFLPLVHRGFGGQPTQRFSDECNRRVLPPHCRGGGIVPNREVAGHTWHFSTRHACRHGAVACDALVIACAGAIQPISI